MVKRSVLIVGAGIAGTTLAYWLHRYGMQVTVVERAPGLRPGGQTVDVRGAGRDVISRMGLNETVRQRTTHELGLHFVKADNSVAAAFGSDSFGGEGFVSEIEILRSEFADVLYQHSRNLAEYLFGDFVTALRDDADGIQVTFNKQTSRTFDLVIAADGIRSKTRGLIFAQTSYVQAIDETMAYFTIPAASTDAGWARWFNAPGGRAALIRPDNLGTTRAMLSFMGRPAAAEKQSVSAQKEIMAGKFADVGWEIPRLLRGMHAATDFYFEELGQVKMPHWSRGRAALVGDAGYCASPISGMGTSLALVGAYILAGELAQNATHQEAFAAYETRMRPYVTKAQKLPPGVPRVAMPQTRAGIALLHAVLRAAATPALMRLIHRFSVPPARGIQLPQYPASDRAPPVILQENPSYSS